MSGISCSPLLVEHGEAVYNKLYMNVELNYKRFGEFGAWVRENDKDKIFVKAASQYLERWGLLRLSIYHPKIMTIPIWMMRRLDGSEIIYEWRFKPRILLKKHLAITLDIEYPIPEAIGDMIVSFGWNSKMFVRIG